MKKVQPTWIYLIGSVVFFGILVLLVQQVLIPRIFSKNPIDKFLTLQKPNKSYLQVNKDYIANIATSQGDFTIDLYESTVPLNVANFSYLSEKGYYDGIFFHRLVPNLLIQGGDRNTLNSDPSDDGLGKVSYTVEDELNWNTLGISEDKIKELESLGYKNNNSIKSTPLQKYSLVMANNGPNTNSSQFFIVLADDNDTRLKELNGQFTVIGKAISGMDVLDKLKILPVNEPDSNTPRPQTPIKINSIKIIIK